MAGQIDASVSGIIELTENIEQSLKSICSLNEELSEQLSHLGGTFQDEGYITISEYVKKSQNKINDGLPDLKVIMEKLLEYAELLQRSRSIM